MFRQSLSVSEFMDQHTNELLNTIQSKKGDYSEFLLLSEDHKKPIRYYPSYLEYQLFTSDREDNNKLFNYINTNKYDKNTLIYIDSELGENIKGEIESEKIFKEGFKNIILSTGYNRKLENMPYWITKVQGKSFSTI